jgi:hypothetical protein
MHEPEKKPESRAEPQFTSTGDILEIREEDTKPAKPNPAYRKWLEEKYGRKAPPENGPESPRNHEPS